MALLHTHIFSETLGRPCALEVILPQRAGGAVQDWPVLWLLHGLSDDQTIWQRRTSIERYVEGLGLAVVMPDAQRSFYTDMASGPAYESFIAVELPTVVRQLFHLSARREDNFIAGLSMGGYGAFKLALKYPEQYGAAASFSGAIDVARRWRNATDHIGEMELIFGGDPAGTENDIFHLARSLAADKSRPQPRLYQCCGSEDFLLQDNHAFRDLARQLGLCHTYEEGPGNHNWGYWDQAIQRALAWWQTP